MSDNASVRLLRPDEAEWDAWLSRARPDVYHSAGYHGHAGASGEGEPRMLVYQDGDRGLAWPYLLRSVAPVAGLEGRPEMDVTSVYGYPGPVAWGPPCTDAFLQEAWRALVGAWRAQGVVTVFTRFHPLLGNASLASRFRDPDGSDGGGLSLLGRTVSLDCTLDDAEARAAYSKKLRQEIAATRRTNLRLRHDVAWEALPDFLDVYRATMDRAGAAERYYVAEQEIRALREALGEHLHLLVAEIDGRTAAAGLFTECEGVVQAHLAGVDPAQRSRSPLKVLLDYARQWARSRGASALHLGGGRGGREDSLFAFKSRFSPRRHDFHTGGWVLDRAAHRSLCAARTASVGPVDPSFFPAYRAGPLLTAPA